MTVRGDSGSDLKLRPLHASGLNRSDTLDVTRGLAIFLVIFGHSLEIFMNRASAGPVLFILWKEIYSFHIPLFFLLSGAVCRKTLLFKERLSRALGLILITILFDIPAWAIKALLEQNQSPEEFLLHLAGLHHQVLIVTWFLPALALVQLLDHVLRQPRIAPQFLSFSVLISTFLIHQQIHIDLFQAGALLPGWIFFEVGRWLPRTSLKSAEFGSATWRLARFSFFLGASFWIDQHNQGCLLDPAGYCPNLGSHFAVFLIHGEIGFPPYFLISALAGCLAVFEGSILLLRFLPRISRLIEYWGQKSLTLLIANGFFLSLIQMPYLKSASLWKEIHSAEGIVLAGLIALGQLSLLPLSERLCNPVFSLARGLTIRFTRNI